MSIAMAVRLVLGLICGGTLTWAVWDRSERELADRTKEEPHEGPRFLPGISSYYLPMLMLLYPILGVIVGGAQMAVQITLGLLIRVFLEMSVYYVLLMAVMPWLRRWVSARVCAMLWLLPARICPTLKKSSRNRPLETAVSDVWQPASWILWRL